METEEQEVDDLIDNNNEQFVQEEVSLSYSITFIFIVRPGSKLRSDSLKP